MLDNSVSGNKPLSLKVVAAERVCGWVLLRFSPGSSLSDTLRGCVLILELTAGQMLDCYS